MLRGVLAAARRREVSEMRHTLPRPRREPAVISWAFGGRCSIKGVMGKARSGYLNLLMALLAAMTLSLPARAEVCGELPFSPVAGQAALALARYRPGTLPGPTHRPLCHLRCHGFVAGAPDAPPQQHAGAPAALEAVFAGPLPATPEASFRQVVNSPPGSSPPRSTVFRL